MRTAHRLALVCAILLPALMVPPRIPAQQKGAKKSADTFLNGAPFTLDQVLRFISANAIPLRRQKDAIQNRGVDFPSTPDTVEKLKAAGAMPEILEVIEQRGPSPQSPKIPAKNLPRARDGEVNVTCAPAECLISIGGTPKGSTTNGALRITGIPPGHTAVDFRRDGYLSAQLLVTIEAGKSASLSATLEPDRSTKEAFGAQLFKNMLQALGDESSIHNTQWIQGEGSATLWARDGSSTRWTIFMRNMPTRALFQAKGTTGVFYEVAFTGSQFSTSKNLKDNDARELVKGFGLVRERQLATLIPRLSSPAFKMVANSATKTDGEDLTLVAESSTETITITLDNDSRPAQVKFGNASGLGTGIATYSDYTRKGNVYYPQSTLIKQDATGGGIGIRLDRFELSPKLKDSDYNMKGKPLPSLPR